MSSYLFDSHALLAFFQGEPGAEIVERILRRSYLESSGLFISLINLGEIVYLTKRRFGDEKKIEVLSRIYQLGFKVLSIPDSLVFQVAELKAQYALSYADCFALACSINKIPLSLSPGIRNSRRWPIWLLLNGYDREDQIHEDVKRAFQNCQY